MPEVAQQLSNGLIRTIRLQEEERVERHEKEAKTIIAGMDEARKTIEQEILRLADLSQRLRTHALRQRDDMTSGYLAYSNAYMRICGALNQGLRRTASMGKVLDMAKANQEESKLREAREEEGRRMRAQNREIQKLSLPTNDDFDLVYGDGSGEVTNAE
jgi:hypothetical protein